MKKLLLLMAFVCLHLSTRAAGTPPDSAALLKAYVQAVQDSLHYQTGHVALPDGVGEINVPKGFRYLDVAQSTKVLTKLWGNPSGENLGMLFPIDRGPLDENNWAFVIQYDQMGYVKDDDADDIDYDDLLKDMQSDLVETNKERAEAGYGAVTLVGWAAKPFYDKQLNALHWAKELQFAGENEHTLNYNVRLLGRKGVLVLNAVGTPGQLAEVRSSIPGVMQGVSFSKGLRYADFNPKLDEVAAYGIGGLIAGKVLAKVGFFALILKFWKILLALLAGAWTAIRRFFGAKTSATDEVQPALAGGPTPDAEPEA
ncbi:DUF2167 domain-containing protein [Hymenobacter fodinae]|uniref:DUF2167 domain-containing protein n=1 Tax=Hymenobacter fodinae TaxID=2510796 RepID=UPI00143673B4|nr:DUF2167 domain-containing protein [Hymenobacter fodinae]